MGTRSLTYVYDGAKSENPEPLINLYRQYDGYMEGHGAELAEFLDGFHLVNGLGMDDNTKKIANGMGDLAAQLIKHFKTEPGQFYLQVPRVGIDCWQEYEYHIYSDMIEVIAYDKTDFWGNWQEYFNKIKALLKAQKEEAA